MSQHFQPIRISQFIFSAKQNKQQQQQRQNEQWPPLCTHNLKRSNRTGKNWFKPNKTFKTSYDARAFTTRDTNHDPIKQITFICMLESDSIYCSFYRSTQYLMVVRSPCIPPVNTIPHGGQISVHSTGQHSTSWWSDHRVLHQSTQYHMVVRPPCIPPVNTVPHGGQITVHSTSQHSASWWSDQRAFHQSKQYLMVVRIPCFPPVSTLRFVSCFPIHVTCGSVQFNIVSTRSRKRVCIPPRHSEVSPVLP